MRNDKERPEGPKDIQNHARATRARACRARRPPVRVFRIGFTNALKQTRPPPRTFVRARPLPCVFRFGFTDALQTHVRCPERLRAHKRPPACVFRVCLSPPRVGSHLNRAQTTVRRNTNKLHDLFPDVFFGIGISFKLFKHGQT